MFLYFFNYLARQQFEADIERLTSDKAVLQKRLQCYEEDLKTANECENYVIITSLLELMLKHCL